MTLYLVRWPMDIEADLPNEHPICSQCEEDWERPDGANSGIIECTRRQRRCPACGSWTGRPEPTNVL